MIYQIVLLVRTCHRRRQAKVVNVQHKCIQNNGEKQNVSSGSLPGGAIGGALSGSA